MINSGAVARRVTMLAVYAGVVVLWEGVVRLLAIPTWLLPPPSLILAAAYDWAPELWSNTYVTLRETVLGFLVALMASVPLAIALSFSGTLRQLLYPIVLGVQSVPKVALAPLIVLWLGIGSWPKIVVVVLVCFFPILMNVIAGLEAVPQSMLDLMRSLGSSKVTTFRRLRVPVALPYLFTGCKVAITFAVIGAIISEFVAAQDGLGYLILVSTSQSQTPLAFAAILVLTAISIALFYGVEVVERRLVLWRP